jgi:hypothetical protein
LLTEVLHPEICEINDIVGYEYAYLDRRSIMSVFTPNIIFNIGPSHYENFKNPGARRMKDFLRDRSILSWVHGTYTSRNTRGKKLTTLLNESVAVVQAFHSFARYFVESLWATPEAFWTDRDARRWEARIRSMIGKFNDRLPTPATPSRDNIVWMLTHMLENTYTHWLSHADTKSFRPSISHGDFRSMLSAYMVEQTVQQVQHPLLDSMSQPWLHAPTADAMTSLRTSIEALAPGIIAVHM